jgi:hypothetical protein
MINRLINAYSSPGALSNPILPRSVILFPMLAEGKSLDLGRAVHNNQRMRGILRILLAG